ncbi:MAG: ABC transporter permease [Saprospiraceae bacterium]|nr:ABC transporter permease [Saprospiraceae bacterium]
MPTLLVVSLATFALSHCTDSDPIPYEYEAQPAAYIARAQQLELHKPLFYFSLRSAALPDTLHRILPVETRRHLADLAQKWGNWTAVDRYWKALVAAEASLRPHAVGNASAALTAMRLARSPQEAAMPMGVLQNWADTLSDATLRAQAKEHLAALEQARTYWARYPQRWKALGPVVHWHGTDNRYHRWLTGFVSGQPGISVVTGNPLLNELRPRLYATLLINGMALLLAYALGVPLGMFMARWRDRWFDSSLRFGILFLYSMPVIWLGSVLMLLLARPDLGLGWLRGGSAEPWLLSGKPFLRWAWDNADRFLLPALTLALHHGAVIALQVRTGMVEALQKDFILTARAKGLSERAVFWRHAFRDGLFPVITTFGYLFPVLFSGSLVVEYLFDFPGMGVKMQTSFAQHDHPVLFAMVMFTAVITLLGMLIADALYAWADPRVRLGMENGR